MLKQKFRRGNLVRINKDLGMSKAHFESDCLAIILGSSADIYDTPNIYEYKVMFPSTGSTSAWYDQCDLTLIEEGGETLIEEAVENKLKREAKNTLKNKNLDGLSEREIVQLLHLIGYEYSRGNNYFAFWEEVKPVFEEIMSPNSVEVLKAKYPEYDIEGVWNLYYDGDINTWSNQNSDPTQDLIDWAECIDYDPLKDERLSIVEIENKIKKRS